MTGVVSWFSTWILFILLLIILSKTTWGKTLVYYALWLLVLLLFVTHSEELNGLFNPQALELNG